MPRVITITNEQELSGMIKYIRSQYEIGERSVSEEYGLGFDIKKIDKTYNVIFNWQGEPKYKAGDYDTEPETIYKAFEDSFAILEDEILSKLEQFVTDILHAVTETRITL
jgi:hypothetical protein